MARPQEFSGKVIPISRSNSNVDVVKKIIDLAKSRNINDKPRIVALLTIAQAESGLNPKAAEKFTYNPQRARAVFGTRLKNYTDQQLINLIGLDKNGRYKDQKKLGDILYSKPGSGSNDNGGNLPNEGYKFRGRGITQITFRGNYEAMMKNLQKQGFSSLDIINNPDLATSTDENSINIFIAGKLEGQFGRKLVEGPDYLNDTRWILATQMGKSKSKSTNPDEWTINSEAFEVYSKARQSIIGTKWIMDLIESSGIDDTNPSSPQIVVAENTKVRFRDKNNNETEISIVSQNFENIPEYKVSISNSDIQPLIGKKIGDKVLLSIPFGSLQQIFPTGINSEVEIISIETINILNPENNQIDNEISQDQNSSSDSNTNNKTNSIEGQLRRLTQFFEPTIKPSIIQQEITPNTGEKETYQKGVGFTPFVWYNGAHMSNIENLVLYHNGILPSVRITLKDTWGILSEDGFPVDDTIITVFINSRSKILRSIFMDFKIVKFQMLEDQNTYEITGVINIPNLYLRSFKSYKSTTSHEALQQLSKDLNIGFCSNIDNTDDKMTWINPGYKNHEYINNVVLNSYHSDEGFLSAYIDFYYNLCYVELEKELNRDITNDKMINATGKSAFLPDDNDSDEESLVPLLLTSDKGVKDTSAYFESFEVDNRSTQISLQKAYRMKTKFYDSNKKEFLVFDVDSITSQGDKTIIMKSRPGDEDYFRNNFATIWTGKIDTGEEGVGNTHPNFNYSIVQNRQNIDDLYKISCKIVMSTPNLNLYKYQKIQVIFSRSVQTISQPSAFTKRLSGDWLITDIEIVYDGRRITQNISLIKRELSLDDNEILNSEKGISKNSKSSDNNEINENPIVGQNEPTGTEAESSATEQTQEPTEQKQEQKQSYDLDYLIGHSMKDNSGTLRNLVLIDNQAVDEDVANAFLNMQSDAKNEGINIRINSGFRPAFGPNFIGKTSKGKQVNVTTQESLRRDKKRWVSSERSKFKSDDDFVFNARSSAYKPATAAPGKSNHGNGIALDINTGSRVEFNRKLNNEIYIWMVKNSWKYGFVRTVKTEEWHFEYRPDISKKGPYAYLAGTNDNMFYSDLGLDTLKLGSS